MTALRTLAQVFAPVETETAAGGRTVDWEPVGDLWLAVKPPLRRRVDAGDGPPVEGARSLAECRFDPRIEVGMRVEIRGVGWRLTLLDRDAPRLGRMTLTLERDLT